MVHGHEDDIDRDAEGDEELGEGVKDQDGQELTNPDPDPGAIPDAEHVDALLQVLDESALPLVLVVVVDGHVIDVDVDERQVGADAVDDLVQDAQVLIGMIIRHWKLQLYT